MIKIIPYILVLILSVGKLFAQTDTFNVSALVKKYNTAKTDDQKMEYCYRIAQQSHYNDTIILFAQKALSLAEKLGNKEIETDSRILIGKVYAIKHDYDKGIEILGKALNLAQAYSLPLLEAKADYELANCYNTKNDQRAALVLYKEALEIYTGLNDLVHTAEVFRQIGVNCNEIGFYEEARKNFEIALNFDRMAHNDLGKALDYAYYAIILTPSFDEPIDNVNEDSLKKAQKYADSIPLLLKDKPISVDVNSAYNMYYMTSTKINLMEYKRSSCTQTEYLKKAERFNRGFNKISKNMGFYEGRIYSDILNAEISMLKGDTIKAVTKIEHLKEKMPDIKWIKNKAMVYKVSSSIYAATRDFERAYNDYNTYVSYKNHYLSSMSKNADFRSDYTLGKEVSRMNEDKKQKEYILNITTTILIFTCVAVLLFTILWRRSSKSAKILAETNHRLSQQRQEIEAQRNLIDQQRAAVEKANVEIYQSISYARHIQQAALPSEETVKSFFPDSFVYYVPKDIVSGDFYYVTQNSGYNIFVLADCTGHGVPGGFLSMLGISAIKDLLKNPEIDILPGIMLDMMREYIKSALSNDEYYINSVDGEDDESFATADGMDMSICAIDIDNHKLRFAGAYQSAYIVREGEIIRLKGDRMPVGRHINEKPNFTTLYFDVMQGDMVYMQSDGIESQIGYTGQKFMTKRLKQFFLDNYLKPCEEQKEIITQIMNDWIFGTIQVDDLSMAGIRIV
ncbi:MAG: SpoIIE family protein phosphatase [Bacteroidales bacterium]|nr:SpoIIE family protein phosphatase [Bacteroidales bacterium]